MGEEQRADDYSYLTSALANEVGLTAEGVWHYERKGVGAPIVAENGYRSYHPQEAVVMRLIKNMTAYGMTLQQASDLVTADPFDLGAFEDALAARRECLVERVRREQITLARLDDQVATLARFCESTSEEREAPDVPITWTEQHSAFWYLKYNTGLEARSNPEINALLQRWLDLMPMSYPMSVLTEKERLSSSDPFIAGGMVLEEENLPDPSYVDERFCVRYPAREYLCCTSIQTDQRGVTLADLDLGRVLATAKGEGRAIEGDIFFQSVAASEHAGKIAIYYKVLIPVAGRPMAGAQ